MNRSIIDARGELCPKPLIMTRKALQDNAVTGTFDLLLDNETSRENVERFLLDNGIDFFSAEKNDYFVLTINKSNETILSSDAEEYCNVQINNSLPETGNIVCFKSDKMGFGSEELGSILIKGCINTIKEITPLPSKLIFYNSGVKLTVSDSPIIASLKELESFGVEILICGTCADFFDIKKNISVGKISNMYDILNTLSKSLKVIYP